MNQNSKQPFYVGQRVVCISAVGWLIKGKVYTVLGVFMCPHCNVWYIQHSVYHGPEVNDRYPCCFRPVKTFGFRSAMAKRFAPYDPPKLEIPAELLEVTEERIDCKPEAKEVV